MMKVLHIKTLLATQRRWNNEQCNYPLLSFVLGKCEEENDDKQLLVVIFCNTMQSKREKKLTKGVGCKVYLEVMAMAMAMARWSSS
jgi:hypothetical protein